MLFIVSSPVMLSLVTWCVMEYFWLTLLNQETFIVSCFSTPTLLNDLICCLVEMLYSGRILNVTVNCTKKCSPLKINTNDVDLIIGILD